MMASVLAIGLAAVITDIRSDVAISEWIAAQEKSTLAHLGMNNLRGVPGTSTFRQVSTGAVHRKR
jgi:hypothetical protein